MAWPIPGHSCLRSSQNMNQKESWIEANKINYLPSGKHTKSYWKWPFIVDLLIENGSLPEGNYIFFYLQIPWCLAAFQILYLSLSGWWCNNHLEKYEFVNGKDDIPYMKWNIKFMFQTTNQFMKFLSSQRGPVEVWRCRARASSWRLPWARSSTSAIGSDGKINQKPMQNAFNPHQKKTVYPKKSHPDSTKIFKKPSKFH